MYILDLDKCKDLPPSRGHYETRDGFCAMGKVIRGIGLQIPIRCDGFYVASYDSNEFIMEVARGLGGDYEWAQRVTEVNDSKEGNFWENHERAFRMAVNLCLKSGVVRLREDRRQSSPLKAKELALV